MSKQRILVIGDSHAQVFNLKYLRHFFSNYIYDVAWVGGATVSGLENPNSKTKTLEKLKRKIRFQKPNVIICLFGEVDCGFVIWWRAKFRNESVKHMFNQAVSRYERFLLDLKKRHKVVVISTPLPTIRDGEVNSVVGNLRKEIQVSQRKRTTLTLHFNRVIEKFCKKNGMIYISLDKESLGENGLIKDELLNPFERNHHYFRRLYADMLIKKFMEAGNE